MLCPHACLLIFAKAPVLGQVKTRLIPDLGVKTATEIHQYLLNYLVQYFYQRTICPMQLWVSDRQHPFFQNYTQFEPKQLSLQQQIAGDLGQRLYHASVFALQQAKPIILIGSDCPLLNANFIEQALSDLQSVDSVIIPAEDGGYVLLGLNQTHPKLFEHITWGSADVCQQTQQQLQSLGYSLKLMPALWDVDRLADVQRLQTLPLWRNINISWDDNMVLF